MQRKVKGLKDEKESKLWREGPIRPDTISNYVIKGELICFTWEVKVLNIHTGLGIGPVSTRQTGKSYDSWGIR